MILNQIKKIKLKDKITLSIVGFTLIFFLLIYLIVIPTMRDIRSMGNEIEGQRVDLEKKYIKGQSLKELKENLKKIEPKLNLLDKIFINKNRELEFITTLENQANSNQVSQKVNLNIPQDTENQEFKKGSLLLYTNGRFNKQLQYLMDLESLSYYINIKSLEILPATAGEQTNVNLSGPQQEQTINMFINADTYWK